MLSHEEGVQHDQVQLLVHAEVASKETILKIFISIGILLDLQFVNDDPIGCSPSCHFHKRHSRSLFQKVPSHKMATTPVDLVGSSPAKRTRVEKH